jgi:uncharacterized surface protein with fasciclin (FAS1) repeats
LSPIRALNIPSGACTGSPDAACAQRPDELEEPNVKTRLKTIGAAAGMAAVAVSLPLSITAHAQPTTTSPAPVAEVPDPQGSGCDAFKQAVPGYKTTLPKEPVSQVLASIPDISTFNAAVSGGLNPAVNVDPVFDNGPYVIFAPTNEAFAALPPEQLDAIKADPAALTDLVYYHAFLGLLGPDDVKGQRPTQQGAELKVDGKGGDIKVNDTAKVVCGGIQAQNARIYIIDTVLNMADAPEPISPTGTSSTSTTATTSTEATPLPAETPRPTATPAADAPIG